VVGGGGGGSDSKSSGSSRSVNFVALFLIP